MANTMYGIDTPDDLPPVSGRNYNAVCEERARLREEVEQLKGELYKERQLAADWAVEVGVLKSAIEGLLSLCRGHQSHHCGCDCSGHNSPDEPTCREAWAAAREALK